MNTVTFDTLKYANTLKEAGVPDKQAEAQAKAQRDSFAEAFDTNVATKADIARLDANIKADMARLEATTKADIAKLDKELAVLKWMVGLVIAGVSAQILKAFFT
ncbi:MAG: DUF1640 domain-containing protein [Rhodoferax sp.]|nr:DUF1640 domain-containing protein [Rhodoferax sp.]